MYTAHSANTEEVNKSDNKPALQVHLDRTARLPPHEQRSRNNAFATLLRAMQLLKNLTGFSEMMDDGASDDEETKTYRIVMYIPVINPEEQHMVYCNQDDIYREEMTQARTARTTDPRSSPHTLSPRSAPPTLTAPRKPRTATPLHDLSTPILHHALELRLHHLLFAQ